MLNPFAQLFQHCWGHAYSLHMDYKALWVVFFPRCTAGPKLVGSCCIRLHTTANTHATTPNNVGTTMLGVVAPVCTQPKTVTVDFRFFVKMACLSLHKLRATVIERKTIKFTLFTMFFTIFYNVTINSHFLLCFLQ